MNQEELDKKTLERHVEINKFGFDARLRLVEAAVGRIEAKIEKLDREG